MKVKLEKTSATLIAFTVGVSPIPSSLLFINSNNPSNGNLKIANSASPIEFIEPWFVEQEQRFFERQQHKRSKTGIN